MTQCILVNACGSFRTTPNNFFHWILRYRNPPRSSLSPGGHHRESGPCYWADQGKCIANGGRIFCPKRRESVTAHSLVRFGQHHDCHYCQRADWNEWDTNGGGILVGRRRAYKWHATCRMQLYPLTTLLARSALESKRCNTATHELKILEYHLGGPQPT